MAGARRGPPGAGGPPRRVGLADAIEPPARSRRRWGGWGALGLADAIEPPARSRRRWGGWGALGLADAIEPPARSRRRAGGMGGHVGAPHLTVLVGGSRPADDQRPHPRR